MSRLRREKELLRRGLLDDHHDELPDALEAAFAAVAAGPVEDFPSWADEPPKTSRGVAAGRVLIERPLS